MIHRRQVMAGAAAAAVSSLISNSGHATPTERSSDARTQLQILALRPSQYDYSRIGASVTVNGHGPFIFAIDSGSQRSMVADSLVERLALRATGQTQVNGVTAPANLSTVGVDELWFSLKRYGGLSLPVARRDMLAAEGLIGLDILSEFKLTFHIEQAQAEVAGLAMALGDGGPTEKTGTNIPPRWYRAGRVQAGQLMARVAQVGGLRCWAFVDNGAQQSVGNIALYTALSNQRRPSVSPTRSLEIYDVPGHTIPAEMGEVLSLDLPGVSLGSTPLVFADLHVFDSLRLSETPALLIGADLMGRFRRVILDYPRQRLAFEVPRPG